MVEEIIERIDNVECYPSYKIKCRGCGFPMDLYFNGGELDQAQCCGFQYGLEHGRIDFVVRKLQ